LEIQFFLIAGTVKGPIWRQRSKFRKNWSNRSGDIEIFVIFKMAAAAIFDFQKYDFLHPLKLYDFQDFVLYLNGFECWSCFNWDTL